MEFAYIYLTGLSLSLSSREEHFYEGRCVTRESSFHCHNAADTQATSATNQFMISRRPLECSSYPIGEGVRKKKNLAAILFVSFEGDERKHLSLSLCLYFKMNRFVALNRSYREARLGFTRQMKPSFSSDT